MTNKALLVLLVVCSFATGYAEKIKYNGYKVFRVTPKTLEHVKVLQELEEMGVSLFRIIFLLFLTINSS